MITFRATRLAPSPTGALHLGHARTFLVTWWLARQAGAKIYMRMEDLDLGRAKPESVAQAYGDLRWLGMDWDACAPGEDAFAVRTADLVEGTVVQSHRVDVYEAALGRLWERGAVYPCTCTRAEIAAAVQNAGNAPHESEGNVRYPGTCDQPELIEPLRGLTVQAATRAVRERTGKNVCWRLRVPAGPIVFEDLIAGPQAFRVEEEVGDFPVTRFVGVGGEAAIPAAYQLACVVDDHAMGVDLVVRGDDLLSSTPRQMLIYRALGWEVPRFAHVPLVVGADGKRLAKRHGESRIAQFREAGTRPEEIVAWAGQFLGCGRRTAREALLHFDLKWLPRERVVVRGKFDLPAV
jgi:glutamyl-tRNA synthetase